MSTTHVLSLIWAPWMMFFEVSECKFQDGVLKSVYIIHNEHISWVVLTRVDESFSDVTDNGHDSQAQAHSIPLPLSFFLQNTRQCFILWQHAYLQQWIVNSQRRQANMSLHACAALLLLSPFLSNRCVPTLASCDASKILALACREIWRV